MPQENNQGFICKRQGWEHSEPSDEDFKTQDSPWFFCFLASATGIPTYLSRVHLSPKCPPCIYMGIYICPPVSSPSPRISSPTPTASKIKCKTTPGWSQCPSFLTKELKKWVQICPSVDIVPPPRISFLHLAAPSTSPTFRSQHLFCSLLVLMKSTDPLLLNETELKLAAKYYEKKHFHASHPETKNYTRIFKAGNKSLNFFKLAAVPWHRLSLIWTHHGWLENMY